jgi:hypothetical protein
MICVRTRQCHPPRPARWPAQRVSSTAQALGLRLPTTFLARADATIEEGFSTHGLLLCRVEDYSPSASSEATVFGLAADRQRQKFKQWLAARAEPNPSEVGE